MVHSIATFGVLLGSIFNERPSQKKTTLFKFQNDAGIPYSAGVYFIEAMWLLRSSKIPFICLSASLILKTEPRPPVTGFAHQKKLCKLG